MTDEEKSLAKLKEKIGGFYSLCKYFPGVYFTLSQSKENGLPAAFVVWACAVHIR